MEFFRGERPWPRPDGEVSENFIRAYIAGERLHPWLNHGYEPDLEVHRILISESFANEIDPEFYDTGARLFQIMLDRQVDIDRTGRPITADDREFALDRLNERGVQFVAEVRHREQVRQGELREREQTSREAEQILSDRGQVPGDREQNIRQAVREVELANTEMLQDIVRLSEQIIVWQQELDQRRAEALQEARQDGASENEQDIRQDFVERESAEVEMVRESERQGRQESTLPGHVESFPIQELTRQRQRGLDQVREEMSQELQTRGIRILDENREPESVFQQQESPQVEPPAGLYESDPDWLMNFDDWCAENNTTNAPFTDIELRRDINGWFQHLRTCQSQARLDWMPFAETFRDAIQAGERCHFEYTPTRTFLGLPLSFRNWCIENADPAEIRVSPMNYIFTSLLQQFADYLRSSGFLGDLAAFLHERSVRVRLMRDFLALIPGAPISRDLNHTEIMEDTPSNWQMFEDIERLCREGGHTTEADIRQRDAQVARLDRLRIEANVVRAGHLAEFTIERQEREQRAREELWREVETDIDDDGPHDDILSDDLMYVNPFWAPRVQRMYNIGGGAAREEREERDREEREEHEKSDRDNEVDFTTGLPAVIQSAIDELHSDAPPASNTSENLGGHTGGIYDEWQRAVRERIAEDRAGREVAVAEEEAGERRRGAPA